MKSAEGQVWRSVAALIQYGFVTDSGTGKSRKFKISDAGRRIVRDPDPDSQKRLDALKSAALLPMIHKVLWKRYGAAHDLSDTVIKGYLTEDRLDEGDTPYSKSAADEVISSYKKTLAYAGLTEPDSVVSDDTDKTNTTSGQEVVTPSATGVKVGDYVRSTSSGVDQFSSRRVDWISDNGDHLRVFGSPTGIPMSEVQIVQPEAKATGPKAFDQQPAVADKATRKNDSNGINATGYVVDGRLQVTADVSADDIDALKEMLTKYQEILRMMN